MSKGRHDKKDRHGKRDRHGRQGQAWQARTGTAAKGRHRKYDRHGQCDRHNKQDRTRRAEKSTRLCKWQRKCRTLRVREATRGKEKDLCEVRGAALHELLVSLENLPAQALHILLLPGAEATRAHRGTHAATQRLAAFLDPAGLANALLLSAQIEHDSD